MSAVFSISEAQLVGLFLEAVFWGIFVIFYVFCMQVLLVDDGMLKRALTINWTMAMVGTLDVGLGLYHHIRAFVQYTEKSGPDAEFTVIADWANILKVSS